MLSGFAGRGGALFLGLGILALVLSFLVLPAVALFVEQQRWGLALGLALAGGALPLVHLARYARAPWGLGVIGLGVLAHLTVLLSGRPVTEAGWALALPNLAFLVWELGPAPLLERARVGAVLRELTGAERAPLPAYLLDRSAEVRQAALDSVGADANVNELCGLLPQLLTTPAAARRDDPRPEVGVALGRRLLQRFPGPAREALLALVLADPPMAPAAQALGAGLAPGPLEELVDKRWSPGARLALTAGLIEQEGAEARAVAGRLLLELVLEPGADDRERGEALDRLEGREPDDLLEQVRTALDAEQPTAEGLWLLVDQGQAEDAPRAAVYLAAERYDLANAALEAVGAIVDRGELGEQRAPTLERLAAGREALRSVHPPGDNPLADGLVGAIEELESELAAG